MIRGVPVGAVVSYAGRIPEGGSDEDAQRRQAELARQGFLWCDGSVFVIDEFPTLYGVIGTSFGQQGDGTFCVPDLRGQFVRGVDAGRKVDPDSAARTPSGAGGASGDNVGSAQADAFQAHEHLYEKVRTEAPIEANPGSASFVDTSTSTATSGLDDSGKPRSSTETRPVNVNLHYIIRAF